ncbi:MAG: ABC transporter permease [Bryobacteraceae bacterium]|nr:ABC transporter permease [Bryobacteraceae bacterium]
MRRLAVRGARGLAWAFLAVLFISSLGAGWLAPAPPEKQFREAPNSPPSRAFLLGTDDLGRDRFSRLLHGGRISLLLAPSAALLAVACAALVGGMAAFGGRRVAGLLTGATDLTLSLPWLLLLIGVRAALPLDVSPPVSVGITFAILGLLGWAAPARVVQTGVAGILSSNYVLAARCRGLSWTRIMVRHVLPNTRPVLAAQFWSSVPVFILAEANLGLLGLGVTEPMPSWGTLLRELESCLTSGQPVLAQYWLFAPALVILFAVLSLVVVFPSEVNS